MIENDFENELRVQKHNLKVCAANTTQWQYKFEVHFSKRLSYSFRLPTSCAAHRKHTVGKFSSVQSLCEWRGTNLQLLFHLWWKRMFWYSMAQHKEKLVLHICALVSYEAVACASISGIFQAPPTKMCNVSCTNLTEASSNVDTEGFLPQ